LSQIDFWPLRVPISIRLLAGLLERGICIHDQPEATEIWSCLSKTLLHLPRLQARIVVCRLWAYQGYQQLSFEGMTSEIPRIIAVRWIPKPIPSTSEKGTRDEGI